LCKYLKELGYAVEYLKNQDGSNDHRTSVVEFPCAAGDCVVAANMPAVAQLDLVKRIQTDWSDSAVSATVYYKKEELEEIKSWLRENYTNSVKSVSFLLHQGHNFVQAPYEEVTKEQYQEMTKNLKPIQSVASGETIVEECDKGGCPIR
jgi:hypothetical protein